MVDRRKNEGGRDEARRPAAGRRLHDHDGRVHAGAGLLAQGQAKGRPEDARRRRHCQVQDRGLAVLQARRSARRARGRQGGGRARAARGRAANRGPHQQARAAHSDGLCVRRGGLARVRHRNARDARQKDQRARPRGHPQQPRRLVVRPPVRVLQRGAQHGPEALVHGKDRRTEYRCRHRKGAGRPGAKDGHACRLEGRTKAPPAGLPCRAYRGHAQAARLYQGRLPRRPAHTRQGHGGRGAPHRGGRRGRRLAGPFCRLLAPSHANPAAQKDRKPARARQGDPRVHPHGGGRRPPPRPRRGPLRPGRGGQDQGVRQEPCREHEDAQGDAGAVRKGCGKARGVEG